MTELWTTFCFKTVKWIVIIGILLPLTCGRVMQGQTDFTKAVAQDQNKYYYYPSSPNKLLYNGHKRQGKCDGEENLKQDIGILSFKLGGISSVAGLFSLTEFSVVSNNISILSTVISLILWVPSAVLTYLATSDPVSWITGNLVNLGSLLITLYGGAGIFFGTMDILVSTIDEVLGITSLILSALTTYPEMFNELKQAIQEVFGKEQVNDFIQGYGCTTGEFNFIQGMMSMLG